MQRRRLLALTGGAVPWLGGPSLAQRAPGNSPGAGVEAASSLCGRKALVIGNASYAERPLNNPVNDARLVAQALRGVGFAVTEHLNLGSREFRRVRRDFTASVVPDDSAVVFYFAGHGIQLNGRNYLLPVDLDLRDVDEVRDESIDLQEMLDAFDGAASRQARIFIIDACRDYPFDKLPSRPERPRKGLAQTSAAGTLIAYSAGPGSTSEDGPAGGNSVYTQALATSLTEPQLPIETLLKRVAARVSEATSRRQVPWVNTSLQVDFSFNPTGCAADAAPATARPVAAAARLLRVNLAGGPQLNTDRQRRSASLALRIYVLRDVSRFQGAAFDVLYDEDEKALGATLLGREIVHLRPGERRAVSLKVVDGAQAIAVFGAFRELDQAEWRATVALPAPAGAAALSIDAQARRVQLTWGE